LLAFGSSNWVQGERRDGRLQSIWRWRGKREKKGNRAPSCTELVAPGGKKKNLHSNLSQTKYGGGRGGVILFFHSADGKGGERGGEILLSFIVEPPAPLGGWKKEGGRPSFINPPSQLAGKKKKGKKGKEKSRPSSRQTSPLDEGQSIPVEKKKRGKVVSLKLVGEFVKRRRKARFSREFETRKKKGKKAAQCRVAASAREKKKGERDAAAR